MLARFELAIAAAISFAASWLPAWLPFFIGVQFVLHAVVALTSTRSREQQRFDLLLAMLAAVAVVNLTVAAFPVTAAHALRLLSCAGIFRAALNLPQSRTTLRTLLSAFGGMSLISAAAGLTGRSFAAPLFVPLSIAVLCTRAVDGPAPWMRVLHGLAACGGLAAAATSTHSETLLAVVVGTLLASTSALPALRSPLRRLLPLLLAVLLIALLAVPLLPHMPLAVLARGVLTEANEAWIRARYLIGTFPFTGVGLGAYAPAVDALYPMTTAQDATDAHNLLLQIGAELGLPGVLTLVLLFARAVRMLSRSPNTEPYTAEWLTIGTLAALAAILYDGLTNISIGVTSMYAPALWLLIGAAVRLRGLMEAQNGNHMQRAGK